VNDVPYLKLKIRSWGSA